MGFRRRAAFNSVRSSLLSETDPEHGQRSGAQHCGTHEKRGHSAAGPTPGRQCDSRDDGFDNNILDLLPDGIAVDSLLAQVVP